MDTFSLSVKQEQKLSRPRRKYRIIGTYEDSLMLQTINGIFSLSALGNLHRASPKQLKHLEKRKEYIDKILPPTLPPSPPIYDNNIKNTVFEI